MILTLFILAVLGFIFWGYPLEGLNFSDFHFYERDLPPLWGLSIVNPQTWEVDYSFLYHNEGLMTLLYHSRMVLNHKRPSDWAILEIMEKGLSHVDRL